MGAVVQFRAKDQKEEVADLTLLTAVMEACREGLAIVESGRVLLGNRSFAQTFGYFEGCEMQGRALADFMPESLFLFTADAGQSSHHECDGVRKDGSEIRVLVGSAHFQSAERELLAIHLRTLNEQEAQQELPPAPQKIGPGQAEYRNGESQRLETLGRVVGGVAHDFNNLLTGIFLYCDLLLHALDHGNPLRSYVEEIRQAGGHSSELVQQLLSAAQPQEEPTGSRSWNEVISGMLTFLAHMLGEHVELAVNLDPRAGAVSMSATAMRQIVLNLVLNARDAMPEGGKIALTVRNCADCEDSPAELLSGYVVLTVTDTGQGMDAATRAHVLEPFFTTKANGNGMGLATIQRLVLEANGSLEIESEPNCGTRIIVRLPQAVPEPKPVQSQIQIGA